MIVDASAILAILLDEPEGPSFKRLIARTADDHMISPFNYLESAIRVDQLPEQGKARELDALLVALEVRIAPTTSEQAILAREAYKRYGKRNHKARLNLGDCFAYALAKARNEPLLFKGDHFRQTDVKAAL